VQLSLVGQDLLIIED